MDLSSQQNKHSGGYWAIRLTRSEQQASRSAGDSVAVVHRHEGLRWGKPGSTWKPCSSGESPWWGRASGLRGVISKYRWPGLFFQSPLSEVPLGRGLQHLRFGKGAPTRHSDRCSLIAMGLHGRVWSRPDSAGARRWGRSKDKRTEPEPGMSEFKMKHFRFVSGGLCGEATPLEVMMSREC